MAIPRRAQAPNTSLPRTAEQTLFLADLPHVGEKSVATRQQSAEPAARSISARSAVSPDPAFPELVTPGKRLGHHAGSRASVEIRFADLAHIGASKHILQEKHEDGKPSGQQQRGWRSLFSQVHTQLAPFAGLIVTLALLTSAGLLFWIISRGQPASLDLQNFQYNEGALSVRASESTPSASVLPISETQKGTQKSPEAAGTSQVASPVEATAEPMVEDQALSANAASPLGRIVFPTTSTPLALDWSKAFDNAPAQPAAVIHGLPEVAEREVSSAESPVAR